MATTASESSTSSSRATFSRAALIGSARLLVASSWVSAAVFGAYILVFFGGTALLGAAARWNEALPGLHDAAMPIAAAAIGVHFAAGGVLLLLGPVQLMEAVRRASPAVHRWLGRLYVTAAALAGLGGLGFILAKGTIGGSVMNVGFGLYGVLIILAAGKAYAAARDRRFEHHRAWAIRLYALAVGSWLYRMEYGFWFLAVGRVGHSASFDGWFDAIMIFFFYLPNLAVAELFIRARNHAPGSTIRVAATSAMLAASAFVLLATFFFTIHYWGPGIVSGITGAP